MKRSWNVFLWAGFGMTLAAVLGYFLVFVRFPSTRDVPWATFLLFAAAGVLLWVGVKRAFLRPERYRGKISGPVLSALSGLLIAVFSYFTFSAAKDLPLAAGAPRPGEPAPDFTLPDANGQPVALAGLLKGHRGAFLIYYRGAW
jgi:hypothetical protein